MIQFLKSKFEKTRPIQWELQRSVAIFSVAFGFGSLVVAATLSILTVQPNLGADVVAPKVITCDDFTTWESVVRHVAELDESSLEYRTLDSNDNGVPCEGLMPRSQHPSEEFDVICDDFQHRDEAEYFFETYESLGQNQYGLDRDLDGRPCETVPPLDEINRVMSRLKRIWNTETQSEFDQDCNDFATWAEANDFFIQAGGPRSDPHRLDGDNNGIPCEALPGAPDPESR